MAAEDQLNEVLFSGVHIHHKLRSSGRRVENRMTAAQHDRSVTLAHRDLTRSNLTNHVQMFDTNIHVHVQCMYKYRRSGNFRC